MPARQTLLPVAEQFVSVNGEGRNAGKLAAFIRFTGCNLNCSYCDTRWANEPGCASIEMTPESIAGFVAGSGARYVTLTGGEPLLQPNLLAVVSTLFDVCGPRIKVEIETNGSVDLSSVAAWRTQQARTDAFSFTMDYKLPSSGMEQHMLTDNFALLGPADVVKFVCGTAADLTRMLMIIRTYDLCEVCNVYVSPVAGAMDPADIVTFMQFNDLSQVTLQLQLHKIIWPNETKGV